MASLFLKSNERETNRGKPDILDVIVQNSKKYRALWDHFGNRELQEY